MQITNKVNRDFLIHGEPKPKRLKNIIAAAQDDVQEVEASIVGESVAKVPASRGLLGAFDPLLIIDWLGASLFVKNIRQMPIATQSFTKIFQRVVDIDLVELQGICINYDLLRMARARLDGVGMLIHRLFFQQAAMSEAQVDLSIYCDTSPQWRGLELFASAF